MVRARRGSEYYNKLEGTTRQWGSICYYFGYIEGSRELIMVDRDDIPPKLLEGDKATDVRVKQAQQVKLLASRAGMTMRAIAQYLDIAERNFYYWCVGDKVPTEEHYKLLLKLKGELEEGGIVAESVADSGSERCRPLQTITEKPTPPTPTPPKVSDKKRAKKGNDPPSRSVAPTEAHSHEFLKNDVTLDDIKSSDNVYLWDVTSLDNERIVKKTNPLCAKCPLRDRPYVPGWGEEGRGGVSFFDDCSEHRK